MHWPLVSKLYAQAIPLTLAPPLLAKAALCEIWFAWWTIYATARTYNIAVGVLHGMDQVMFLTLWFLLPYIIAHRSDSVVNTIEFVTNNAASTLRILNAAYAIFFVVLISPQIVYVALIGVPFMRDEVCPHLPWASPASATPDLVILTFGLSLNLVAINATLLFLAMTVHIQSFLVNDFLHRHLLHNRSAIDVKYLKNVLHLTTQSLREGNAASEPINTVLVLGFMLELIEVVTKMLTDKTWTTSNLLPLGIVLVQIYFFIIPAAYVTKCWDRVFHEILSLHALALTKEDELSPIIVYMKESYRGYTITNIRIDSNIVVYFTYLVIAVLAVKSQRDVHFWLPN